MYAVYLVCYLLIGDGNTYCESVPAMHYADAATIVAREEPVSFIYDQQESKEIFDIIMAEQNGGVFNE